MSLVVSPICIVDSYLILSSGFQLPILFTSCKGSVGDYVHQLSWLDCEISLYGEKNTKYFHLNILRYLTNFLNEYGISVVTLDNAGTVADMKKGRLVFVSAKWLEEKLFEDK
jgi:hypothetical protein